MSLDLQVMFHQALFFLLEDFVGVGQEKEQATKLEMQRQINWHSFLALLALECYSAHQMMAQEKLQQNGMGTGTSDWFIDGGIAHDDMAGVGFHDCGGCKLGSSDCDGLRRRCSMWTCLLVLDTDTT